MEAGVEFILNIHPAVEAGRNLNGCGTFFGGEEGCEKHGLKLKLFTGRLPQDRR